MLDENESFASQVVAAYQDGIEYDLKNNIVSAARHGNTSCSISKNFPRQEFLDKLAEQGITSKVTDGNLVFDWDELVRKSGVAYE